MQCPKNSNVIFHRSRKINPKIHMEVKIAKVILSKKDQCGDITILDFKLYYRTIVTKTTLYWHKSRHIKL
jgi:hypothetical protein